MAGPTQRRTPPRERRPLEPPAGGKARRTYDTLVQATQEEIVATGALKPEGVAARAGMGTATFYAYFAAKEDALAATLDRALEELVTRCEPVLGIEHVLDAGLRGALRDTVHACLDVFRDHALVFRLALASLPQSRAIRQAYRARQEEAEVLVRRAVELGTAAGRVREGDAGVLATTVLVILQGLNNPLLLVRPDDDPVVEAVVDALTGLLEPTP